MESLKSILPTVAPQGIQGQASATKEEATPPEDLRAEIFFKTEEEATRICPLCKAMVAPKKRTYSKVTADRVGFLPWMAQKCQCEIQVFLAEKAEKDKLQTMEARRGRLSTMQQECYCWLGGEWDTPYMTARTFDTFEQKAQRDAFNAVEGFSMDPRGTLVLHGKPGTGKTHLLGALCNAALSAGTSARFVVITSLFEAISERLEKNRGYLDLLRKMKQPGLLVVDDADKIKWSEFQRQTLYSVFNYRIEMGLPIAMSLNDLDKLEAYVGEAIEDRLRQGQTPVRTSGESYRLRKHLGGK